MSNAVILSAARTPIGKLGGTLAAFPATTLGGEAIRAAVERSGLDPAEVEHVIMGQVIQAGVGQAPARQASFKAGLAKTVTSETINKVCASGMLAVANAARYLRAGDFHVIVAGGMESMSNAPYLLQQGRFGYRFGDGKLIDAMTNDGLWDYFLDITMARAGALVAKELGMTREAQDEFAYNSHKRATDAAAKGLFKDEIVTLKVATKAKGKFVVDQIPQTARARVPVHAGGNGKSGLWSHEAPEHMQADSKKYSPYVTGDIPHTVFERDESVRAEASLETMAKLAPIDKDGTITAGNAPGVNDAAAALVLASEEYAKAHGAQVLGTVVDHATAAWDPPYLALTPAMAAEKLLEKNGLSVNDIALWEINEAFSSVVLTSFGKLGVDYDKVNVQGGAVAMGHPIGMSGARIIATLAHQLRRRGGGLGIAAICSGGGQGDAILIRVD